MEQVVQSGGGFSVLRDIQNPAGHSRGQLALADPVGAGYLD